jgi:hypothetical protein
MDQLRRRPRDSHELSEELARHSVVDSMLQSLGGFGENISSPSAFNNSFPDPEDDDPYVVANRTRVRTHSSSISEFDKANIDDTASKYAAYHSQGRTKTPVNRSRKNSRSKPVHSKTYPQPTSYEPTETLQPLSLRSNPSRGHSKKPSQSSSVDVDWDDNQSGLKTTPKRAPRPPPLETRPSFNNEFADFDDSAPTPTIAGGPRRRTETLTAISVPPTPKKGPSRQNSVKSSRTMKRGKTSSGVQQPPELSLRDQARQFVNATNSVRNGLPVTPSTLSAAPSPTVGGMRQELPSPPAAQPFTQKEKTGFFRKFFGSSRPNQNPEENSLQKQPQSSQDRPKTQPAQAPANYQSLSRPPTQDPHNAQGLRKSTSSFFRRRKKSISENADIPPVPTLNLHHVHNVGAFSRLSLMNRDENNFQSMMATYLKDNQKQPTSPTSPGEIYFDSHEVQPRAETAGEPQIQGNSKKNKRKGSLKAAQNPSLQMPGTNGDRSREMDNNTRQISAGQGSSQPNSSPDLPQNPGEYFRQANRSPSFLSDKAMKALSKMNSSYEDSIIAAPMPQRPAPEAPALLSPSGFVSKAPSQGGILAPKALSPISDRSFLPSPADSGSPSTSQAGNSGDEYVISQNTQSHGSKSQSQGSRGQRVWLKPSDSEEQLPPASSSASNLPFGQVDANTTDMDEEDPLTEVERTRARQIFEGDESFVTKALAASWLGQKTEASNRTRTAYMDLFDWNGVNILTAFRELCSRLIIRAEAQQLDRVIDSFSERWSDCNPNNGFKSRGMFITAVEILY